MVMARQQCGTEASPLCATADYRPCAMEVSRLSATGGFQPCATVGCQRYAMEACRLCGMAGCRLCLPEACPPRTPMFTEATFRPGQYSCENWKREAISHKQTLYASIYQSTYGQRTSWAKRSPDTRVRNNPPLQVEKGRERFQPPQPSVCLPLRLAIVLAAACRWAAPVIHTATHRLLGARWILFQALAQRLLSEDRLDFR